MRFVLEISGKIDYWLDIAEYDMETAQSMHNNGNSIANQHH